MHGETVKLIEIYE